jgi:hypothetical protein
MDKIDFQSTTHSAREMAGPGNNGKSQSLHLDRQIIRTLTGAELKFVGGGGGTSCGAMTTSSKSR